jgi:NADP-dependent 3-hydroxy acid dehydrogenase YdfG
VSEPPRLEGQWALVTGAGGGIGSAIVEALAAAGARVALAGRRRGRLERIARQLGQESIVLEVDLDSEKETAAAARLFLRQAGRLDILVHSSGIHLAGPLGTTRVADFDRLWTTNVRAPLTLTQSMLPALREAGGQIVFINSSAGIVASPGTGMYSATHHARRALADSLRAEVNPDGVRVLSVYPGRTATKMQERIYRSEKRPYEPARLLQPTDIAEMVVTSLALPRSAEVTDLQIRSRIKP